MPATIDTLLKKCPFPVSGESIRSSIHTRFGEHTLCVGEEMDAFFRTSWSKSMPFLYKSGTIGFLSFEVEGNAMAITYHGVEPAHQGKGYAAMMLDWSYYAAKELKLKEIAFRQITSGKLERMAERRGYTPMPFTLNGWSRPIQAPYHVLSRGA